MTAGWSFWGQQGQGPRIVQAGFYQANPGGLPNPQAIAYINSNVFVHNTLFGRQSVLEIGVDGNPAMLAFGLQNYNIPESEKLVHIQITYRPGFGAPLRFDVGAISTGDPPWQLGDTVAATVIDTFNHPDGWRTASYGFTLDTTPAREGIAINFTSYPAYVDQVWIDTLSVPGPGPAGIMLGLLAVTGRRRR